MTWEFGLAVASAAWFGVVMAISPCPLATNITAIAYIGRQVASPRAALLTGLLYALGRSLVYVAIAAALVAGVGAAPELSTWLQKYMNKLLGPVLILVGMLLLGLIDIRTRGSGLGERVGQRVAGWGVWAGLALGVVFALSFCPASASLYFAGAIPLAIKHESALVIPLAFGVATALPVVAFAILLVFSANAMARAYQKLGQFERWARWITGLLFIVVGVYFCLAFIFRIVPTAL